MYFLLAFYFYKRVFLKLLSILFHKTIFLCRTEYVEKIVETIPMDAP